MASSPPVILTIAGSDSCAGAGLQADIKAIGENGGYGICAVTAIVSEVPGSVSRVLTVEPELLADQLELLVANYPVAAIKTGMLGNRQLVRVVANFLQQYSNTKLPVVVDPVMVATSGDRLLDNDAIDLYRDSILPLSAVATPNLDEATVLLETGPIDSSDAEPVVREFYRRFGCPVILKGGHFENLRDSPDMLFDGTSAFLETARRIPDIDTHGTGCTFSAAIAALLGKGLSLAEAFAAAKAYVTKAIAQSHHWPLPRDIRALNHQPENVA